MAYLITGNKVYYQHQDGFWVRVFLLKKRRVYKKCGWLTSILLNIKQGLCLTKDDYLIGCVALLAFIVLFPFVAGL